MRAGTNAINAALHLTGITPAENAYPSQPGVFYELTDMGYVPQLKQFGDALHVGRPPVLGNIPDDVKTMMELMEQIETYRDPCVRGDLRPNEKIIKHCDELFFQCIDQFKQLSSGH